MSDASHYLGYTLWYYSPRSFRGVRASARLPVLKIAPFDQVARKLIAVILLIVRRGLGFIDNPGRPGDATPGIFRRLPVLGEGARM